MFYTFSSTIMMAFAIRNVRSLYRERKQLKRSLEFAEKQQTLDKLKLLDTGNGVPRDTFILAVLEQLGVLDRDTDIQPWIEVCLCEYYHFFPIINFVRFYDSGCANVGNRFFGTYKQQPDVYIHSLFDIFLEICGVRYSQYRTDPSRGTIFKFYAYCFFPFS